MQLQYNNLYPFTALEDGDVFYFAGDKKKLVCELRIENNTTSVKPASSTHFTAITNNMKGKDIIFLRKKGTV